MRDANDIKQRGFRRGLSGWMGWTCALSMPAALVSMSLSLGACSGTPEDDDTETPTAPVETPTATLAPTPTDTPEEETPTPVDETPTPVDETPTDTPPDETPTATPPDVTPTEIPATPTLPPVGLDCADLPDRSIVDIQTDASLLGKRVRVSGVLITTPLTPEENSGGQGFYTQEVPDVDNGGLRMQADSGTLGAIQQGKIATFCGEVGEDRSNTYLAVNPDDITLDGDGTLPTPALVDACTLATTGEVYEGRLVQVVDVVTTNPSSGNQTFTVEDCLQVGTEFFNFQSPPYPMPEQPFKSITGVVRQVGEGNYRIQPRTLEDMVQALFSYAEPNTTSFTGTLTVTLKANVAESTIYYTLDGSEPSVDTSESLTAGETLTLEETTTLKFFAVSGDESESVTHTEEYERLDSVGSILISEVAVQGSDQEFIEIYNPTEAAVDLSKYYLTDLSNPDSTTGEMDNDFTRITTNTIKGNANDFLAKFPDGTMLEPGKRLVIILAQGDAFKTATGVTPDFEVVDKSTTIANMVLSGPPASQVGLSNSAEFVMLFTWDGTSKLVQDIDYFRWTNSSTSNTGVNRTDLKVGDQTYKPDVALNKTEAAQAAGPGHSNGQSMCRKGLSEGAEVQTGGNGVTGADETSEDFLNTWEVCTAYTPGL